jgi:hypothetical protein
MMYDESFTEHACPISQNARMNVPSACLLYYIIKEKKVWLMCLFVGMGRHDEGMNE